MSDQHKWMDEHKYVNTTSNHVTTLHFGNEYRELSRAIHVTSQPFKSSIVLLTLGNITSMTLPSFKTILNHSSNCCWKYSRLYLSLYLYPHIRPKTIRKGKGKRGKNKVSKYICSKWLYVHFSIMVLTYGKWQRLLPTQHMRYGIFHMFNGFYFWKLALGLVGFAVLSKKINLPMNLLSHLPPPFSLFSFPLIASGAIPKQNLIIPSRMTTDTLEAVTSIVSVCVTFICYISCTNLKQNSNHDIVTRVGCDAHDSSDTSESGHHSWSATGTGCTGPNTTTPSPQVDIFKLLTPA